MRTTRWQLTSAGAIVLATSLGGAASAQVRGTHGYVELPSAPVIAVPAPESIRAVPATALPSSDGAPAAACCESPGRGGRFHSAWERFTTRLEQRCVPQEPDPIPLGQFIYQNFDVQVTNGIAARMVLHDYDFALGTSALTPRGRDQLEQIVKRAQRYPFPVIIERPAYSLPLGEARRRAVLDELRRANIALGPDRVIVGAPPSHGLSGIEANFMFQNLLLQTQSRGWEGGAGGAGTGTTIGAGATTNGGAQGTPGGR